MILCACVLHHKWNGTIKNERNTTDDTDSPPRRVINNVLGLSGKKINKF